MMTYLVRYDEINLKGKNRKFFENRLVQNISKQFKAVGITTRVEKKWRRILVHLDQDSAKARRILSSVFGLVSFSPIRVTSSDLKSIIETVEEMIEDLPNNQPIRFRMSSRRSNKDFPLTSQELNEKIGEHLLSKYDFLKVDLKNFDLEIGVEVSTE